MAKKKKLPKSVYQGVGHRLVFNWLFPKNTTSLLGPTGYERKPKIYALGRLALFDGGVGLLSMDRKRKPEVIPDDFNKPFPPLEFPPVDDWGLDEWRDYALLQQDLAEVLQEKLGNVWGDLVEARDSLTRRKSPTEDKKPQRIVSGGLLGIGEWKKRGRPKGSRGTDRTEAIARDVILLQEKKQRSAAKAIKNTGNYSAHSATSWIIRRHEIGVLALEQQSQRLSGCHAMLAAG